MKGFESHLSGRALPGIRQAVMLVGVAAALWGGLPGCATSSFTYRSVRVGRVPEGSSIAVTVWAPKAEGTELTELEGYLSAGLLDRGLKVRTMRPELLLGRSNLARLFPKGAYSTLQGLALGLRRGGALQGDPKAMEGMLSKTEMDDAKKRLDGLVALVKELPEAFSIKYLLVVHRFDRWGFAAYTVNIRSNTILGVLVVSGDRDGFVEALGYPASGRVGRDSSDGDASRLELMRFAEHVARFVR
ncbi:MAG: hypothetical protein RBU30_08490 [Polyangia bacterium]|jgi:hypothetical protein|nr:hypothetical protein [Polyangia bacterium]